MATVKTVKQLCADVEKGDAFAAFLICKRRRLETVEALVELVKPMGVIDPVSFDACADGWALYRRYLSDAVERAELERLSVT